MKTPALTLAALPLSALLLAGCATMDGGAARSTAAGPQAAFFERLSTMCGRTVEGRIATSEPAGADTDFAGRRLVARGVGCSANEIRIAFDVGEDRSRTWIITRQPNGLRLKHRHMLTDGREDELSQYGGDTATSGTASRQEFPTDQFSRDLFTRTNRAVSVPNVWAFEIEPGRDMTYELARPGRLFRVTFDLTR